ncbi:MAG: Family 5 extracellular solute-binding protein [Acidobacteria bacterium]|nr:Family 5 extracellular solute-binding protein [Acidobacteriota bacterium]
MKAGKTVNYKEICARASLFSFSRSFPAFLRFSVFCSLFLFVSCSELKKPVPEPFYAETKPPQIKEFRWSNGKMPKSFDPARAAAAPETDIVRALFDGLTETDSKTLKPIPAMATEWSASEDFKTWTFKLRRDAKWSNGKNVTAADFARSWKRLADMSEQAAHRDLLQNIAGVPAKPETEKPISEETGAEFLLNQLSFGKTPVPQNQAASGKPSKTPTPAEQENKPLELDANQKEEAKLEVKFGVEAVGDYILKVSLIKADKDFPALVAHPIFRPVYGDGKEYETDKLNAAIVTNGAFRITSVGGDGITLDRFDDYWNREKIEIERVRFVPTENAETALELYRAGEIDAVTNVNFEPLVLKLLTSYDDFRRTTHSALNFYEFNRKNAPFNDRRVREALAISIERERLTEGDMEGATEPALGFLPAGENQKAKLVQDSEKARQLLAESGFPNGENFPQVRLIVNRNDIQQRIARSVARMWKRNLNIDTEIIAKEASEFEIVKKAGDFDIIRRGVVLPTIDETANMLTIFEPKKKIVKQSETAENLSQVNKIETSTEPQSETTGETEVKIPTDEKAIDENAAIEILESEDGMLFLTEAEAVSEFPAIPLYFPTSYSLVKPYILGFEINMLDAPLLKDIRINNNWQPKEKKGES